jgi:hypothetical protein
METNTNKIAATGSILALALGMGVSAAQAGPSVPGNSQAAAHSQSADHASDRAKEQLRSLGNPGATGVTVGAGNEEKEEEKEEEHEEQKEEPQLP